MSKALGNYGWLAALLAALVMAVFATYVRPVAPVVDPLVNLIRSPDAVSCPSTWTETAGKEPDTGLSFKTCTSPEGRYIVTLRQGQAPVGLDTSERLFMSQEDISWLFQ